MPRARLAPLAVTALLVGCGGSDSSVMTGGTVAWLKQGLSTVTAALTAVGPGTGIGASDLYCEGGAPPSQTILKYSGLAWAPASPTVTSCLTCKTPRTVQVGGTTITAASGGAVQRLDPSTQMFKSEPTGLGADVLALWAGDASHLFAVGAGGGAAFYDGMAWHVQQTPTAENLRAVWGANPTDVYAVGDKGVAIHFDGKAWTVDPTGTGYALLDVWGSSPLGFFAVGEAGTILHRPPLQTAP